MRTAVWRCLVLLFLVPINYNLSLGFALTFLLAACAVIDMHLTFRNLAYLHLSAGKVARVFSGEDALFELHVINRHKHPRYAIWFGFIGHDLPALEQPLDVVADAASNVTLVVTTSGRRWRQSKEATATAQPATRILPASAPISLAIRSSTLPDARAPDWIRTTTPSVIC